MIYEHMSLKLPKDESTQKMKQTLVLMGNAKLCTNVHRSHALSPRHQAQTVILQTVILQTNRQLFYKQAVILRTNSYSTDKQTDGYSTDYYL